PSSAPTCAQQCTHLCLAVRPPVPSSAPPPVPNSAPTCAAKQCHTPVLRSATYLSPAVPPTCTHPHVPTSATHLCPPSVPPISAVYQCRLSMTPH
ncbi:unnamed protein product, partial [Staurois parvus]